MHKNHVATCYNVVLKWRDAGKRSFFSVPELCIHSILYKLVVHTPCSGRPGNHNKVQCVNAMCHGFFVCQPKGTKNAQNKDGFQQKKSWNVLHSKSTQSTYQTQSKLGIFAASLQALNSAGLVVGTCVHLLGVQCTVFFSWSVEMHEICDLCSTLKQNASGNTPYCHTCMALPVGIECIGHEVAWSRTAKSNTPPADPHANWPLHVAGVLTARATLRGICMRKMTLRIESKRSKSDQILDGHTWPYLVPNW